MKQTFLVRIVRPGYADLPELVRTDRPEIAAEVVRVLLAADDPAIQSVIVEISHFAAAG